MNVVSSMLLFLGEKIYALGKLSTLSMPEPEPHKMSIITNRNHAQGGGGEPEVMTFSVPEEGYSSLGVDATGTIVPFTLPLSVEHGGSGVDSIEKLKEALGIPKPWTKLFENDITDEVSHEIDIKDKTEILIMHRGRVSTTDIQRCDTFHFFVADLPETPTKEISIVMGGSSSATYGCSCRISKTNFRNEWTYQAGTKVTAYPQYWNVYVR